MKSTMLPLFLGVIVLNSCTNNKSVIQSITVQRDSLLTITSSYELTINQLRDSVRILSYTPEQRLSKVKSLLKQNHYDDAESELRDLFKAFPHVLSDDSYKHELTQIDEVFNAKYQEEARIKALGFKALKSSMSHIVDYNNIVLSNISIGSTYSFDDYGDSYYYKTADRGRKYITMVMKVTSESLDPKLPELAVYTINGDKMLYESHFLTRFQRWEDYGTYLGNYHSNRNDFSKTSSVSFKLGADVFENNIKGPYAIVLKNENALERQTNRTTRPTVSYTGHADFKTSLTIDDFSENGQYSLVKIYNLK